MNEKARDPAELLKKHFTTLIDPDAPQEPRYAMSNRNRARMEKLERKVRELRGQTNKGREPI
jgi:hypothetical protein